MDQQGWEQLFEGILKTLGYLFIILMILALLIGGFLGFTLSNLT